MLKEHLELNELKLVGVTARTNNQNEINPETSKIGPLFGQYLGSGAANSIKHRTKPAVTYSIYTNYESDENGDYTYFLGELVDSFDEQDLDTFETLTIPASQYQKLTSEAGQLPDIVISSWMDIWKMTEADFGGERSYIADFEVFDERAADPENAVVDIYIGLKA